MDLTIGIVIGVLLTFVGEYISHRSRLKLENEKNGVHLKGLLQAIHDEVETVWNQYQTAIGAELSKLSDGTPFLINWKASQDYFTVFNTNAYYIGKIKDDDLRKAIIATYIKAKSLIDSLLMNDEMNRDMAQAKALYVENNSTGNQKILKIMKKL